MEIMGQGSPRCHGRHRCEWNLNEVDPCDKDVHPCKKSSRTVQELVQESVLEVQMADSRTSVLELQELVQEVQMASSRTSVHELVREEPCSSRTEVLEPAICTSRTSS